MPFRGVGLKPGALGSAFAEPKPLGGWIGVPARLLFFESASVRAKSDAVMAMLRLARFAFAMLLLFEIGLNLVCLWWPEVAAALPPLYQHLPRPLPPRVLGWLFPTGGRGAVTALAGTSATSSY